MNNRRHVKSASGRKGNATRGGTPGSHVNTKRNKRIANKAARRVKEGRIGWYEQSQIPVR